MATGVGSLQHEDSIYGKSPADVEVRGRLVRITRHAALAQLSDPALPLRLSEVLEPFNIQAQGLPAYHGRATVTGLVDAGTHLLAEFQLEPTGLSGEFLAALPGPEAIRPGFHRWLADFRRDLQLPDAFKLAVADLQTTLVALQRWTEHLWLRTGPEAPEEAGNGLATLVDALAPEAVPLLNQLFERYETAARDLSQNARPAATAHVQRLLLPIVLCAPFARRTYEKPLGYAGDFEMVNMMVRDPREGDSLFAQLFNVWLLGQDSATAHRHRIRWLVERLTEAAATAARDGRRAQIYSLGCGPAWEVQEFLSHSPLASQVDFTLADVETAALDHARTILRELAARRGLRTGLRFARKSVRELLRDSLADGPIRLPEARFDLFYCAGLFDYLSDAVCRQVVKLGCSWLRPGGRFLCTNVTSANPNRASMELILEWHLCYRDAAAMLALVPPSLTGSDARVLTELTGANVFLELTPSDAH